MSPLLLLTALGAHADPCGMVPPMPNIAVAAVNIDDWKLERQGDQITFAFHKNGVQDIVVRPGFIGNVAEFGMLIPFPSPPAIRKTADDTFVHLAAAVDPPLMRVEVRYPEPEPESVGLAVTRGGADSVSSRAEPAPLAVDEVRVLSEEAIGMYEVAVLEAGSAGALSKWMADHSYRYPEGMDATVDDYVAERWAFVAVKAKVGDVAGTAPRPGMRAVNPDLPPGASFEGYVQGMGFRFKSEELVIPMRLAAFNNAPPKNLVYVLAEHPLKIDGMDTGLVQRQVDGETLKSNLTDRLKVSINGADKLTDDEWGQIYAQRNPAPYNGLAAELFASDLLAAYGGKLALPLEEQEKALLEMSAVFGLEGAAVEQLHHDTLAQALDPIVQAALGDVSEMTLTVLEGDFDATYLAERNLTFADWQMADDDNNRKHWSRRPEGPSATLWR